ncbi:IS66 family transposase [Flammeovirga aprica]|uniref:Transposase TnpC homeodomain domain-containing protein n=1 Tax=Flammeovirga aprica JL-4 TaxID=694437 RepID=A0A7X9S1T6_9BACT|nr:hypothetical protein [Flammeovirga aprica]NME72827.1 hypothetical protein [Flammeovirga aprica JL-4]
MSKDEKIASLEHTNTSLNEENAHLKAQVAMFQSMLFGAKSEKRKYTDIPKNQLSIFEEEKKPVRTALPENL